MPELCGSLEDVGLPALVRFLTSLGKSGCLRVSEGDSAAEVSLDHGRVVAVSFASQHGLAALDAMVLLLPRGQFGFSSSAPMAARDVDLAPDELQAYVDSVAAKYAPLTRRIPSPALVPRVVEPQDRTDKASELSLDCSQFATLRRIDGRRTVAEIAAECGPVKTFTELALLADLGLIRVDLASTGTVTRRPAVEEPPPLAAEGPCPKLGFADDPVRRYSRSTQLHRCFAGARSEHISLEEQGALCLTDRFPTCPRLAVGATPRAALELSRMRTSRSARPEPLLDSPAENLSCRDEPDTSSGRKGEEPPGHPIRWSDPPASGTGRPALSGAPADSTVGRPLRSMAPKRFKAFGGEPGDPRRGAPPNTAETAGTRRGIVGACVRGMARIQRQKIFVILGLCVALLISVMLLLAGRLPLGVECCAPPFLITAP